MCVCVCVCVCVCWEMVCECVCACWEIVCVYVCVCACMHACPSICVITHTHVSMHFHILWSFCIVTLSPNLRQGEHISYSNRPSCAGSQWYGFISLQATHSQA